MAAKAAAKSKSAEKPKAAPSKPEPKPTAKAGSKPAARRPAAPKKQKVAVGDRELELTNPGKVLYPATGTTKAEVIGYYARVAEALLPHLEDRPITLKRYPDGVDGEAFFEKRCPKYRPEWMQTFERWTERRQEMMEYCVINDLPSLVWVANLAAIELHAPLAKGPDITIAQHVVFDLDPGPPATAIESGRIALLLRDRLNEFGLKSLVKTSGSKGIQVYVPLNCPGVSFDETKLFARTIAEEMASTRPAEVVSVQRKELRTGKVLIDWSQNDENKTTISVYSMRGRAEPTVSTPIAWKELERAIEAEDLESLRFRAEDVLRRVRSKGDLFAPLLTMRQRLPGL